MNKIIFFIILILFAGCNAEDEKNNENSMKLILKMTYYNSENLKSTLLKNTAIKMESGEDRYTQFGDYITSITPTIFIGKFLGMRLANWDQDSTTYNYQVILIDGNTDVTSPVRLADFSNNASVDLDVDMQGLTKGEFNLFYFTPMFFYQELELPAQYDTVSNLDHINYPSSEIDLNSDAVGGVRSGRYIKGNNGTFINPIYNLSGTDFSQIPQFYVFGSTDSTYTFFGDGTPGINNPGAENCRIIRSKAFNTIVIEEPENGGTTTINGTLSFYTDNLIQIYAGEDNIPYTRDDIFVYAPNFWERLSVSMSVSENK